MDDNFYCISFTVCKRDSTCRGHSEVKWRPYICHFFGGEGVASPVSKFEHTIILSLGETDGFKKSLKKRINRIEREIRIRDSQKRQTRYETDGGIL